MQPDRDDRGGNEEETSSVSLLLARLDERMRAMHTNLADIRKSMQTYLTVEQFAPYKALLNGLVALILVSFVGALIYLVGWKK